MKYDKWRNPHKTVSAKKMETELVNIPYHNVLPLYGSLELLEAESWFNGTDLERVLDGLRLRLLLLAVSRDDLLCLRLLVLLLRVGLWSLRVS